MANKGIGNEHTSFVKIKSDQLNDHKRDDVAARGEVSSVRNWEDTN